MMHLEGLTLVCSRCSFCWLHWASMNGAGGTVLSRGLGRRKGSWGGNHSALQCIKPSGGVPRILIL